MRAASGNALRRAAVTLLRLVARALRAQTRRTCAGARLGRGTRWIRGSGRARRSRRPSGGRARTSSTRNHPRLCETFFHAKSPNDILLELTDKRRSKLVCLTQVAVTLNFFISAQIRAREQRLLRERVLELARRPDHEAAFEERRTPCWLCDEVVLMSIIGDGSFIPRRAEGERPRR